MASGRQTIKQRIALDGGKDIQDQLQKLGAVGEKAFAQIRKAALKADLAKFGKSLNTFGKDLATVGRRVGIAFSAVAVAGTAAGVAVFKLAKGGAEAADAAGKAAQATGLQIDAYGRLAFAAEQSGVAQTEFQAGMARLNRELGEAATGSKTAIAKFTSLGVSIKGVDGKLRPTEEIMKDLANAFQRLPDGAAKSALAIDLFGRSGANLLPFLNSGAQGLAELGKQAEALGIVFSPEQFKIAEVMNDTLAEVGAAVNGIKFQLGLLFAPAITAGAAAFRDVLIQNRDAIVRFGQAVVSYGTGILADFVNLLLGNDARVQNPWILEWRDAIVTFGRDLTTVVNGLIIPLFNAVRAAAQLVADGLNKVFGTDISAGAVLIGAAILKLMGVFTLFRSAIVLTVAAVRLLGSALALASAPAAIAGLSAMVTALRVGAVAALAPLLALVGWPALIVAGVVAAGAAIYYFWDEIVVAADYAWKGIVAGASATWDFMKAGWDGLVAGAVAAWDGISAGAAVAWDVVKQGFDGAKAFIVDTVFPAIPKSADEAWALVSQGLTFLQSTMLPVWEQIKAVGSGVWSNISSAAMLGFDAVVAGATGIFTRISTVFAAGVEIVRTAFQPVADLISSIWSGATDAIAASAEAIFNAIARATELAGDIEGAAELAASLVKPFIEASAQIDRIFAEIRNMAVRGFNAIKSEVGNIAQSIEQMIARILSALQKAAAAAAKLKAQASGGGSSSGSAPGLAGGGHVRGAGSATSDSIPAWLSNGEFVIKAAAVRKFGPQFFAMLNSMRLPKGFSMGGIVSGFERSMSSLMPVQRFAQGGPVLAPAGGGISGRPITVIMPGGESFELVADESVAEKLQRFAMGKAVRSAGRAPGWVGA